MMTDIGSDTMWRRSKAVIMMISDDNDDDDYYWWRSVDYIDIDTDDDSRAMIVMVLVRGIVDIDKLEIIIDAWWYY